MKEKTIAANTEKHKMGKLQKANQREKKGGGGGFGVYKQINTSITQGVL